MLSSEAVWSSGWVETTLALFALLLSTDMEQGHENNSVLIRPKCSASDGHNYDLPMTLSARRFVFSLDILLWRPPFVPLSALSLPPQRRARSDLELVECLLLSNCHFGCLLLLTSVVRHFSPVDSTIVVRTIFCCCTVHLTGPPRSSRADPIARG